MSHLYPSIISNNKYVCDICHYAKQKHLPFSTSLSKVTANFELLHFDIWGPISISYVHGHRYFLTILDDHSKFLLIILFKICHTPIFDLRSYYHTSSNLEYSLSF